jgi:predicted CXXCH cytochrome family protein
VTHAAVTDRQACLNCHSPHAGKTETLLVREDVASTCKSCHDRAMFEKKVKHPEQDCETCHAPHGSQFQGLLVDSQIQVCLTCHDDVDKTHFHPYSGPAKDPRTGEDLVCTSCHNPHSSEFAQLLTHDKARGLCVQCHLGPNLEPMRPGGR